METMDQQGYFWSRSRVSPVLNESYGKCKAGTRFDSKVYNF